MWSDKLQLAQPMVRDIGVIVKQVRNSSLEISTLVKSKPVFATNASTVIVFIISIS